MHRDSQPLAVSATVVMLVLAAVGLVEPRLAHNDGPSYQAGYAAASNPQFVRTALSDGGMSSMLFCDELLHRRIVGPQRPDIQPGEFHRGCEHAVHDVME